MKALWMQPEVSTKANIPFSLLLDEIPLSFVSTDSPKHNNLENRTQYTLEQREHTRKYAGVPQGINATPHRKIASMAFNSKQPGNQIYKRASCDVIPKRS